MTDHHILYIDILFVNILLNNNGVQNDEDFHVQGNEKFEDSRPLKILSFELCRFEFVLKYTLQIRSDLNQACFPALSSVSTVRSNCTKVYTRSDYEGEIPERNCENINVKLYVVHV